MRSLAWISGERPPVLGISKGRGGLGKEGAEASAQCGGVCSGIRILRVLVRGATPLSRGQREPWVCEPYWLLVWEGAEGVGNSWYKRVVTQSRGVAAGAG